LKFIQQAEFIWLYWHRIDIAHFPLTFALAITFAFEYAFAFNAVQFTMQSATFSC